jgi:hypothetical protein
VATQIDPRKFDQARTVLLPKEVAIPQKTVSQPTNHFLASESWVTAFAASFSELRQALVRYTSLRHQHRLHQLSAAEHESLKSMSSCSDQSAIPLPKSSSAAKWLEFCIGADSSVAKPSVSHSACSQRAKRVKREPAADIVEHESDFGAETPVDIDDSSDSDHEPELAHNRGSAHQPSLQVISRMDSVAVNTALCALIDHLSLHSLKSDHCPLTVSVAAWLYALLAALDKPILADTAASLRALHRTCVDLRAKLTANQDPPTLSTASRLNLIMTIVDRCFQQRS